VPNARSQKSPGSLNRRRAADCGGENPVTAIEASRQNRSSFSCVRNGWSTTCRHIFERDRKVHEIEIEILEPEIAERLFERIL